MLQVLYQDKDIVVVNKRSGLLVHRSLIDRHETTFAVQLVRDQIGAHVYPVHRLDKPTSGALVFALSSAVAHQLSLQFSAALIHKRYLAVVRGVPKADVKVDYALKEELDSKADLMSRENKPAQPAVTDFRILARCEFPIQVDLYPTTRYALVEAIPHTGRKHQVRRHLRHLGHPIIGDVTYGVGKHNRFFQDHFGIRRLLLACTEIGFKHPVSGEAIRVRAPLAAEMQKLFREIGWSAFDV